MKDPYKILGVDRSASKKEIQKSYRKLAKQYHPDVNKDPEAVEKFKEVAAAYEILEDDNKRAEYDRFGDVGPRARPSKPFTSPIDDFFSSMFGGGRAQQVFKGEDIRVVQEVELEDVLNGSEVDITYKVKNLCEDCGGTGGEQGDCPHCDGKGAKIVHGRAMTVKTTCHACQGTGKTVTQECGKCDNGFTAESENVVTFRVHKGVEDGMRFSLREMGHPCAEGVPGNLHVMISVKKHDLFSRLQDGNLLHKVPIKYTDLVFGKHIDVPTLSGESVTVKVPEGTKSGTKFRLKGLGLPLFNNGGSIYKHGDQLVQVDVIIPLVTDISDPHKATLDQLAAVEGEE